MTPDYYRRLSQYLREQITHLKYYIEQGETKLTRDRETLRMYQKELEGVETEYLHYKEQRE